MPQRLPIRVYNTRHCELVLNYRRNICLDEIKYLDFWRLLLLHLGFWKLEMHRCSEIPQDTFGPPQDHPGYKAHLVGWVDDIKIDQRRGCLWRLD